MIKLPIYKSLLGIKTMLGIPLSWLFGVGFFGVLLVATLRTWYAIIPAVFLYLVFRYLSSKDEIFLLVYFNDLFDIPDELHC